LTRSLSFMSTPTPAPQTHTLPYTTLFRSVQPDGEAVGARVLHRAHQDLRVEHRRLRLRKADAAGFGQLAHLGDLLAAQPDGQRTDRKSTRLNSSHVKISYAVFCLKKKKKT